MIKWQVVVDLPDNLTLTEAVKIRQEAERTIGLPTTLKITRIEQDKPKRQQLWLIR